MIGRTRREKAAQRGLLALVRQPPVDPNAVSRKMDAFLKAGASLVRTVFVDPPQCLFEIAFRAGHPSVVEPLWERLAPTLDSHDRFEALRFCVRQGQIAVGRWLVTQGVPLTPPAGHEHHHLLRAACSAPVNAASLIRWLCSEHGMNPNLPTSVFAPLLHQAINHGSNETDAGALLDAVDALLDAGADPNAPYTGASPSGETALHAAASTRRWSTPTVVALCKRLLAAGADPNVCTHQGEHPLGMAQRIDAALRKQAQDSKQPFDPRMPELTAVWHDHALSRRLPTPTACAGQPPRVRL